MVSEDPRIPQLQAALHETQTDLAQLRKELEATRWLVGGLRYIADGPCARGPHDDLATKKECLCYTCAARGVLLRYDHRKPFPKKKTK